MLGSLDWGGAVNASAASGSNVGCFESPTFGVGDNTPEPWGEFVWAGWGLA